MHYIILLSIFILLQSSVKMKEVLKIGDKPGVEFLEVFDACTDSDGNIYVSDKLEYTIKKFDRNGNLINKVGKRGQGPGEFRVGPGKITCAGDVIAVVDFTTSIIHLFTKDLKFIKTISAPFAIADITSDESGNIYAVYVNLWGTKPSTEIAVFRKNGDKLNTIKVEGGFLNPFEGFVNISYLHNYLVLCYYNLNKVSLLDRGSGKLLKELSVDGLPKKSKFKKIEGVDAEVPEETMFLDVATDSNKERILLLGGGYSRNPGRDVYILDKNGKLIQTITLPEKTKFIYVDNEGNLYVSGKDHTIIKKIKFSIPN
jgi:hypothetical protein